MFFFFLFLAKTRRPAFALARAQLRDSGDDFCWACGARCGRASAAEAELFWRRKMVIPRNLAFSAARVPAQAGGRAPPVGARPSAFGAREAGARCAGGWNRRSSRSASLEVSVAARRCLVRLRAVRTPTVTDVIGLASIDFRLVIYAVALRIGPAAPRAPRFRAAATGGRAKNTLSGGSLGSWVDEERSKMRVAVLTAGHDHRHFERKLRPGSNPLATPD